MWALRFGPRLQIIVDHYYVHVVSSETVINKEHSILVKTLTAKDHLRMANTATSTTFYTGNNAALAGFEAAANITQHQKQNKMATLMSAVAVYSKTSYTGTIPVKCYGSFVLFLGVLGLYKQIN